MRGLGDSVYCPQALWRHIVELALGAFSDLDNGIFDNLLFGDWATLQLACGQVGGKEMTERKFTDEEVIRALECCSADNACDDCPIGGRRFRIGGEQVCNPTELMTAVLDLINRQRAEIEGLKGVIAAYEYAARESHEEHVKQQAIIDEILTILRGGQPNDPPSVQSRLSSEIE